MHSIEMRKTEYGSSRKHVTDHNASGHDGDVTRRQKLQPAFVDPDEFFHDLLMEQQEQH